jgi:hypothetical protein
MPLFGDLIKSLCGKAGIKPDDETLKKILAFQEVSTFEIPEEFSKPMEQNLLTEESARANPNVRSPLFAEALNGLDTELNNFATDLPFDDVLKGEIKSISKNTHEKARKINTGVKNLLASLDKKQKEMTGNPQKDEKTAVEIQVLKSQIDGLNRDAENLKMMHKTEVENLQSQHLNERKNYALRSSLASKPLPKNGVPQDVNIITAETLVKQEMAKHGLQFFFDEFGNAILKQRKDGADIDFFVDNKKIGYNDFIDGVLAQNKFLQLNDQSNQNGNNESGPGKKPLVNAPGIPTNQAIVDETNVQLQMLGAIV